MSFKHHSNPIQNPFRGYCELIQTLFQTRCGIIRNPFQCCSESFQTLLRDYSQPSNMNLDGNGHVMEWRKIIDGTSDKMAFEMKKVAND